MEENVTSPVSDDSYETPNENDESLSQIITQVMPCQFDLSSLIQLIVVIFVKISTMQS